MKQTDLFHLRCWMNCCWLMYITHSMKCCDFKLYAELLSISTLMCIDHRLFYFTFLPWKWDICCFKNSFETKFPSILLTLCHETDYACQNITGLKTYNNQVSLPVRNNPKILNITVKKYLHLEQTFSQVFLRLLVDA